MMRDKASKNSVKQRLKWTSADKYFSDRPNHEGIAYRFYFREGFDRGYDAAIQSQQSEIDRLKAEVERLGRDAKKWKQMAEFQYAVRRYPNNLDLGEGALDAYFKGWSWETAMGQEEVTK